MRIRLLIVGASVVLLSVFLLADWHPGKYLPKPNEELYGKWINEKSINAYHEQKIVNTPEGWEEYFDVSDSVPLGKGKNEIDSEWTDSEGNVWYKTFSIIQSHKFQELDEISKSGTVWESVFAESYPDFDSSAYPTKIDPKDPTYRIFYRAKE